MQRVRMSLPYYCKFGWQAEVVVVDTNYTDVNQDPILTESIPPSIVIHRVNALPKKWTAKFGLGSIALRSLLYYRKKVNELLRKKHYDLIYFSTTQFPVCILGPYWKKRFRVPYVIDMQDPWLTDYYQDKPKTERPPKYWLAHFLNKKLEPGAMGSVDGLIAVSKPYIDTLVMRYPRCQNIPKETITFGFFADDFRIAEHHKNTLPSILPIDETVIPVVYIGRGGTDMAEAVSHLFLGFLNGLKEHKEFQRLRFYFIGTSYATGGHGKSTILPIAEKLGVVQFVSEITDRIPFYQTLNTLKSASALFVPGSNDPHYTASKIYPYVMAKKPLLTIFHPASSVVSFLQKCGAGTVLTFDQEPAAIQQQVVEFLEGVINNPKATMDFFAEKIEDYSAKRMTEKQCDLFNRVIAS